MQRSQNERVAVKCGPYSSIANPSIFENGPSGDCAPGSLGQLLEEIRSAVLMDRSFVTVQDRLSEEYDSDEDSEDGRTSPFNRFDSAKELVVVGTRRFYEGAGSPNTTIGRPARFIPPITVHRNEIKISEEDASLPRLFVVEKTSTSTTGEEPTGHKDEDLFALTWGQDWVPPPKPSEDNQFRGLAVDEHCSMQLESDGDGSTAVEELIRDVVEELVSDAVEELVSEAVEKTEPKPKRRGFLSAMMRRILRAGRSLCCCCGGGGRKRRPKTSELN